MKYSVVTFGCRVNQADSLAFEEELLAAGGQPTSPGEADVVVVNTCSVTASADQGARQTIRRIARSNPNAKIFVTGCYATRHPGEIAGLSGGLQVVVNSQKDRVIPLVLESRTRALTTAERYADGEGACGASLEPGTAGRTAFTLRVQTGCAEPCSYCIIPTTRGAPASRSLHVVMQEIERVAMAGFKEIVLTGVHLGSYGRDLRPACSLIELLDAVATRWRGSDHLFRISSLEPMDCTREVVQVVASADCFAPHLHLPLQHASNRILAAMRRPYTLDAYEVLVDDIRRRIPHVALGTDVIVGFPGETDRDFETLAAYLERSPLTHVHVFPYSDRPGTDAALLPGKVPGAIVRGRAAHVRQISDRLSRGFRLAQLGTSHRALTLDDGTLAVTGNYLKVRIPPGRRRNEWVTIRLADEAGGGSRGVVLDG